MKSWVRTLSIVAAILAGIAALVVPRLDLDIAGSAVPCDEVTVADQECTTGRGRMLADSLVVAGTIAAVLLIGRLAPEDEEEDETETAEAATGAPSS